MVGWMRWFGLLRLGWWWWSEGVGVSEEGVGGGKMDGELEL